MYTYELAKQISAERNCGFWEVAGTYFFDKMACLRYATQQKTLKISYDFFNDVYSSLDWTREPSQTLDQLYVERARQLRDKYDYLVLTFSGGADSSNILDVFLENNIPLDEVVSYYPVSAIEKLTHRFDGNSSNEGNHMFEYLMAAAPRLKQLSNTHPQIKITIIDFVQDSVNEIVNSHVENLWGSVGLSGCVMFGQRKVVEHVAKYSDKKKVCIITGADKPRILWHKEKKQYGSYFMDTQYFGRFSSKVLGGYEPQLELFYYTKDLPTLTQKQCFVIKKVIDQLLDKTTFTLPDKSLYSDMGNHLNFDVNQEFFKRILYKNWNSSIWQVNKNTNFFYMPHDAWFFNTNLYGEKEKDFYSGQMKEIMHGIHKFLINKKNNIPTGFRQFPTPINYF